MNSKKTIVFASRFVIIVLSILAQIVMMMGLFFVLGRKFAWVEIVLNITGALLFLYLVNKDQPAVFKLPWLILILLFPLCGIILYFTFGNVKLTKKQLKRYRKIYDERHDGYYRQSEVLKNMEEDNAKGLPIVKYLRSATSLPVFDNSKTQYLKSGEEFYQSLCSQILRAEHYVFLEYFIVEEGKMLSGVMSAIERVVARGVEVYFMYDDVGSISKVPLKFEKELCKKGINAKRFFKFIPIVSVRHNNRDHRKIAVIDGKVGFMSGANIADEYINEVRPFGRWLDCAVKIEGQATDSLVRLFIQLYNMSGGDLYEEDFIYTAHHEFSGGYLMPFGDSPSPIDDDKVFENVYLSIISRADKYLYITTPYLIVDTNITDALKSAVKRGVDVRIIIPQVPDKKTVYTMTKKSCLNLMQAGVKIYAYKGGFIHSKTFLCDGEIGVVGTANLDYRSLVHHFECGALLCQNPALIDLYGSFLNLFECETVVCTAENLKLNFFERIVSSLLGLLSPLI